ncbi:hypothetical protein ES704_03015 [subsurface metagenome]|jgi:arsenate reductase-like glutaredoxin family protein
MQKKTLETKNQLEKFLQKEKIVDSTTLLKHNVQNWKVSRTTLDKLIAILQKERKIIIRPILCETRKFNIFYCAKTQNVT